MLEFERHLDEQIDFPVTLEANGNRQSLSGVDDLRMTIYRQTDLVAVVENDQDSCSIEEAGAGTEGDVRFSRAPGAPLVRGRYLCKFLCTIAGKPISFPQKGFIGLVIT